jgi:thiamine biosynthesis protein ThiS
MQIHINGQTKSYTKMVSLDGLISELGRPKKNLIAELNGTIIPAEQWPATSLQEGDTIELVSFVGGG